MKTRAELIVEIMEMVVSTPISELEYIYKNIFPERMGDAPEEEKDILGIDPKSLRPRTFLDIVREGSIEIVKEFVVGGGDVNILDEEGESALHIAVETSQPEMVRCLLSHEANINVQDDGYTPLHLAVHCSERAIISILIEEGADISITNDERETPLVQALNMKDMALVEHIAACVLSRDAKRKDNKV